jgi:hypothetical protein
MNPLRVDTLCPASPRHLHDRPSYTCLDKSRYQLDASPGLLAGLGSAQEVVGGWRNGGHPSKATGGLQKRAKTCHRFSSDSGRIVANPEVTWDRGE